MINPKPNAGFQIPDVPTDADLTRCVHCGLCLSHCPTYRLTGLETESPRGRLFLIRHLADGTQDINLPFLEHIGLCLDCRNCETVCPSGVRYGALLEAARGEIVSRRQMDRLEKAARWLLLKQIWPHPLWINVLGFLLSLYQRTRLQRLVRAAGLPRLLGRLGELEALLPTRPLRRFSMSYVGNGEQAEEPSHPRVALFTDCISRAGFAGILEASIRVLEHSGYRVIVPERQACCGALHIHSGEQDMAREMARRNITAFEESGSDAIVVISSGCGSALKEYGELLQHDPAFAERAAAFSKRVLDLSQALAETGLPQRPFALEARVTFQEPCHLVHAQRLKKQPRTVLRRIEGLQIVEMRGSDRCCGSAGIYNVLHPAIANQLADEKMADIAATGVHTVVTANVGCWLQLEYGKKRSGWKGRVAHIAELLDEARK